MEFLKTIRKRSFLHEVLYVVLNVGLAIAFLFIIRTTNVLWPAIILMIFSKWRVFAVRPRFWLANTQADLVSTIVSVGYIVFLYLVNGLDISGYQILAAQMLLVILYIGWLLFLRPQSKRVYIIAQSAVALFVGVTAIFSAAYAWPLPVVVLMLWLVGFSTSRHVLASYDDENHIALISPTCGFVMAEIGWLLYHWVIAYEMPIFSGILLPQISIIVMCFGFLIYKVYDSYHHNQSVRFNDIVLPLAFTIGVVAVLLLAFNRVNIGAF